MLKGEDIVVLLKISGAAADWTVRSLAGDTGIPRSVAHRSIGRLVEADLLDARHRRVNVGQAEEFLVHGSRYVFPPTLAGEVRGIPTAWAASPLRERLAKTRDLPPVWPDHLGETRGIAMQPLHPAAPKIAAIDPALAELLALVDALRLADARVRGLAAELLAVRLEPSTRDEHRAA